MLTLERTRTEYAVAVGVETFRVMTNSPKERDGNAELYDQLNKIPGVSNIEYNGHFGPAIYFRLDFDEDKPKRRRQILATIDTYLFEMLVAHADALAANTDT